jgi:hypothetical protein
MTTPQWPAQPLGVGAYPNANTLQTSTTALIPQRGGADLQALALQVFKNELLRRQAPAPVRPQFTGPIPTGGSEPSAPASRASDQADDLVPTFGVINPGGPGYTGQMMPWHPGMPLGAGQQVVATGFVPKGYAVPNGPSSSSMGPSEKNNATLESIDEDQLAGAVIDKKKRDLAHAGDVGPTPGPASIQSWGGEHF